MLDVAEPNPVILAPDRVLVRRWRTAKQRFIRWESNPSALLAPAPDHGCSIFISEANVLVDGPPPGHERSARQRQNCDIVCCTARDEAPVAP
ncbi:hypothetical protein CDAR_287551 [Caerostris darwini]|uniref:Uncharacterized protein n=1 Tax=Caerostris darwini TaxID=1538125 RepID=A0AAV4NFG7_9ARAC|nr:hypothetical protein CDAR_287551 [Caerostris darwini]